MSTNLRIIGLLLASALLATACKQDEPAAAATEAATVPAPTLADASAPVVTPEPAAPVTLGPDSPIWFEPAALSSCGKGAVVLVHWNAVGHPGVSTVKVMIAGKDGKEILFATTGVANQKQTGAWAIAGTEVVVRDANSDAELARAAIPAGPCETGG